MSKPITSDDQGIKKVLGQKQPAIVVLYDGREKDKPLHDALKREAKKHDGELLVIAVDASENPDTHARYGQPQTPALVTLTKAFFGRNIKSSAEGIRPADIRAHIDHLLNDMPLPEEKPADTPVKSEKGASHVTDKTFRKSVLRSKQPVLVDFWADWCAPCHSVAPFIDELARKYNGQVKVVKLNVDENKRTAGSFQVQSIPTFILFEDGEAVERLSGASPRAIETMVQEALHRQTV